MPEGAFIDANILLYSIGTEHPLKQPATEIWSAIAVAPEAVWSSAEVLQELFHVLLRRGFGNAAATLIEELRRMLDPRIVPLTADDVSWCLRQNFSARLQARDRAHRQNFSARLQARDRAHLAVMNRLGIANIISADRAFDGIDGIQRLDPADLSAWRSLIFP